MKLSLHRETLLKPLQLVIGVVERKQTLPILSNVLLSTQNNNLSITGTDLEVELVGQTTIDQILPDLHQITVPGRKLMDICRALPENAPIELYREKERVVLRSGRSRFTLATLPAEDFPNLEKHESHLELSLPQRDLRRLLQRTYFSMAQQDVRYYLNGLLLEVLTGKIRAVATDGHRLATQVIDVPVNVQHRIQIILPRKGVIELLRLLNDTEETVHLTFSNNHVRVSSEAFIFTSKLIEGRFPDYERVIPKNADKQILIDSEVLKQALTRTAILCNEKFKGIRFELRQDLLHISANNPEQEAAEEEVSIDYNGPELDIGFNVSYLIDILNTTNSGPIRLSFSDSNNSVLIEEADSADESAFVVMPMRL